MAKNDLREKIYGKLNDLEKYHFAPIEGEVKGRHFPINPTLEALTYILDRNCLLTGDPGWGKTTSAKLVTSVMSGVPYDLLDSTEIRGHPHLYEEKLTGRFDFHKLQTEGEKVIWKSSFSMPSLIVDEANWIPYEGQSLILQGIETGRWLYMDHSFFEGKKPTFFAINKRPEDGNGLWHALEDRMDISLPFETLSTLDMLSLEDAKSRIESELSDKQVTNKALELFDKDRAFIPIYLENIAGNKNGLTATEKEKIRKQTRRLPLDDDAKLFLQSFVAEINFNQKYGKKRTEDPISDDTHDKNYAGVLFKNNLSPRAWMAIRDYSSALAWLLGDDKVTRDHLEFVIPYTIHHKLKPTNDTKNELASRYRTTTESIAISRHAVQKASENYNNSIRNVKNLIGKLQSGNMTPNEINGLRLEDHDHPLIKDFIRKLKEKKPFYGN